MNNDEKLIFILFPATYITANGISLTTAFYLAPYWVWRKSM